MDIALEHHKRVGGDFVEHIGVLEKHALAHIAISRRYLRL